MTSWTPFFHCKWTWSRSSSDPALYPYPETAQTQHSPGSSSGLMEMVLSEIILMDSASDK